MLQGNHPTLFKTLNLSFTTPAPKTLKTIQVKKGCCKQCWPTVECKHPDSTGWAQKGRAESVDNTSKPRCLVTLFRTPLHYPFQEASIEYYRLIVKGKISITHPFFCFCWGWGEKYLTDNYLHQFAPPEIL